MDNTELLQAYTGYLRGLGFRLSTYNGSKNSVNRYLGWLEKEKIHYLDASYTDLLAYIRHLQELGNKKNTINSVLNAIRHFYNHLQDEGKVKDNPVGALRVRNVIRQVPHDLLEWEDLENMYRNYAGAGITGKRNKAMLGLLIYQGLTTAELHALEENDLKLEEGRVYVPQTGRSNSRTLKLEAFQVLQLQKYVTQVRPVILQLSDKTTQKLFISTGKGSRLDNSTLRLLRSVQQTNPKVKSFKQIRASVLTEWLKRHNIRQVQYMAGHRYISSTEHYRTDTLETLQDLIDELHPLG